MQFIECRSVVQNGCMVRMVISCSSVIPPHGCLADGELRLPLFSVTSIRPHVPSLGTWSKFKIQSKVSPECMSLSHHRKVKKS